MIKGFVIDVDKMKKGPKFDKVYVDLNIICQKKRGKNMKKILLILTLSLILCGCAKKEESEFIHTSDSNEVEQIMKDNNYIIVDVRTKEEYKESHLVNAINIPYDEIDEEIDLDKSKTILVYCKSGNRSGIAYNTLTNLGYEVYDLGAFADIDLPKE